MAKTLEDVKEKVIKLLWDLLEELETMEDAYQMKAEVMKSVMSSVKQLEE